MPKYSNEFKTEAVKRVFNSGDSTAKIARELGVNVNSLNTKRTKTNHS